MSFTLKVLNSTQVEHNGEASGWSEEELEGTLDIRAILIIHTAPLNLSPLSSYPPIFCATKIQATAVLAHDNAI